MKSNIFKRTLVLFLSLAMVLTGMNYTGLTVSAKAKKATLKLNKTSAKVKKGKKLTLKIKKTNVKKIKSKTWSSSKKSVATVSKKGVVTGKKAGKATIKVKVKYIAKGAKKTSTKTLKCKVTVTAVNTTPSAEPTVQPVSRDGAQPFIDLSPEDITKEMGLGWNLGNTMDGHSNLTPGEMAWQNGTIGAKTSKELIKYVHDRGFNNIRIPVTWGNYINADYSINEEWIARVQEIVDYAIDEGMYVLINIHHDGADHSEGGTGAFWLTLNESVGTKTPITDATFEKVLTKFKGVWTTLANRFKNYDEHLLFAGFNEVYGMKAGYGTNVADISQDMKRINALNEAFVNTVRATGGNNDKRWLVCPSRNTTIEQATDERYGFKVPDDPAKRVMVEMHEYTSVAITGVLNSFNEANKSSLSAKYKLAKETFIDKGIPVYVGEAGTLNSSMTVKTAEGLAYLFKKYGLIPAFWDDTNPQAFAIFDRKALKEISWDGYSVADNLARGFFYITEDSQVSEKPTLVPFTSFDVEAAQVSLKAGETKTIAVSNKKPDNSNDVVVWGSSDSTIASVYDGKIVARGIGTATVTASSAYDENVKKEITVTVTANTLTNPTTEIKGADSLTLSLEEQGHLDAYSYPVGNGADLHYVSANPDVATVSSAGTVRGLKSGQVKITITSSDGFQKVVPVTVKGTTVGERTEFDINLALHAFYNWSNDDNTKNYGGTDIGSTINVTKDGTYTLVFDCASDLSAQAKTAGVTSLNGIGALYIKDWDVTQLNYTKSPNYKGKIRYTSIKVDGKELLPETTEYYDCLKADGVFDTGNPLNVWRLEDKPGSPKQNVELNGASVYTHPITGGLSFKFEQENPQKIEVTFELDGFKK